MLVSLHVISFVSFLFVLGSHFSPCVDITFLKLLLRFSSVSLCPHSCFTVVWICTYVVRVEWGNEITFGLFLLLLLLLLRIWEESGWGLSQAYCCGSFTSSDAGNWKKIHELASLISCSKIMGGHSSCDLYSWSASLVLHLANWATTKAFVNSPASVLLHSPLCLEEGKL